MKPRELTIRGLVLGALIATIFTAANVYLGLKVGLTFASSIPAAVISMVKWQLGTGHFIRELASSNNCYTRDVICRRP